MQLRRLIHRLFEQCGYTFMRTGVFELRPKRILPDSLDALGMAIDLAFPPPDKPLVLQVGAFDGVTNDPVFKHLTRRRLPAILVEPVPESVQRLRRTYAGVADVHIVQAAIAECDSECVMYRVREDAVFLQLAERGVWPLQLASFNREHLLKHCVREQDIEEIRVRGLTITTLLAECAIEHVDVLQVDAEGMDDHIVTMGLELKHPPDIIHFEHGHLPRERYHRLLVRLGEAGYQWMTRDGDTLAMMLSMTKHSGRRE